MQTARRALISIPRFASSSRSILQASFSTSIPVRTGNESASAPKPKAAKKPLSSCPAGTVLTGLSILKDQPDPVAKPDEEYPAWLWTLLDPSSATTNTNSPAKSEMKGGQRDFAAEKKRLRAANRANIKATNYLKTT